MQTHLHVQERHKSSFCTAEIWLHVHDETTKKYPQTSRLDAVKQESGESQSGNR